MPCLLWAPGWRATEGSARRTAGPAETRSAAASETGDFLPRLPRLMFHAQRPAFIQKNLVQ